MGLRQVQTRATGPRKAQAESMGPCMMQAGSSGRRAKKGLFCNHGTPFGGFQIIGTAIVAIESVAL